MRLRALKPPDKVARLLGIDISAALLDLGDTRLAAMDAAGIDMQCCRRAFGSAGFCWSFRRLPRSRDHPRPPREGLPFVLHRLNDQTHQAAARRGLKKTLAQYLTQNLAVTCSDNFSVPAFLCAVETLDVDNVMFSVDWPYESNRGAVEFLDACRSVMATGTRSRTSTRSAFCVSEHQSPLPLA